jgi:hypothetical protein
LIPSNVDSNGYKPVPTLWDVCKEWENEYQ